MNLSPPTFLEMGVTEKFGGNYDGKTPDYRAFLYYKVGDCTEELRGYGADGATAASEAWQRFLVAVEEFKLEINTLASVLEDAANYVWNGKTDCPSMSEGEAYSEFTSLHLLNEVRKYNTDYIKFAQELVYERMKNHGDMWGFLRDKGVPNTEITQELLQLHRKQWLHALAEELRGKNVLES